MKKLVFFVASTILAGTAAQADTFYNTQLANVNGTHNAGVATTTTTSNGTVTTVAGPANGPLDNRVGAGAVVDTWAQQNVGAFGSVGITKDYAQNGNGSIFFESVSGGSKADLEYYLSAPVALSSFQGASYDWYRDSTSTNAAFQVPSLRMLIGDASGAYQGYLIFEPVYNELNGNLPAATDSWQTSTITLASRYWSNNGNLNEPAGTLPCPDCYGTIAEWQSQNPTSTIIGFSTGVGSGWSGTFRGAVDNISFTLGGATTAWNFEVADTAAVPEPASWAMMIGGFGLVGGAMRRRRQGDLAAA